jgi:tyrosine decarboxylase/aspartate 1-decarboxylase
MDDLKKKITNDTAFVIGVAGTTELGVVDPIEEISQIIGGVHLHVDAAFGGFVLPFLRELKILDAGVGNWDFMVEGVTSLSTDPHKMGWSTIPAGCLLLREENMLRSLAVESPYLTSPKAFTLAGTRDSGAVASAFAMMKLLGIEGYMELVKGCMERTSYLRKRLEEISLFPVVEPTMNIIAVAHDDPSLVQDRMKDKGYYLSKVLNPNALRFVIMPHVTKNAIDDMVQNLDQVLKSI